MRPGKRSPQRLYLPLSARAGENGLDFFRPLFSGSPGGAKRAVIAPVWPTNRACYCQESVSQAISGRRSKYPGVT